MQDQNEQVHYLSVNKIFANPIFNCFSGDVKFITSSGAKTFKEMEGHQVFVLNIDGNWESAIVKSYGKQQLQKITFRPRYCNGTKIPSKVEYTTLATMNHRWILADQSETTDLEVGCNIRIIRNRVNVGRDSDYFDGFAHGLIFGDGSAETKQGGRFRIRLCKDENNHLANLLIDSSFFNTIYRPKSCGGDFLVMLESLEDDLKALPENKSWMYLNGFIEGWLEADSRITYGSYELYSINKKAIDWIIDNCAIAGYAVTGIHLNTKPSNFGPRKPLHSVLLNPESIIYQVVNIEVTDQIETVYCVETESSGTFTLAGGLLTGNCRGNISPLDVVDLAKSIEKSGLLQPIIVRPRLESTPSGFDYEVVAGHRRHKACQVNNMEMVSCLIKLNINDFEARTINAVENIKRKALNMLQEANTVRHYYEAGWNRSDIAKELDVSPGWVQVRCMILELPLDIQEAIAAGIFTQTQIRDLHGLKNKDHQYLAARKIKEARERGDHLTVESKLRVAKNPNAKRARKRNELFLMQDEIYKAIGNNLATRALGWAAGEVSDMDFYCSLKEYCDDHDMPYSIPEFDFDKELQIST